MANIAPELLQQGLALKRDLEPLWTIAQTHALTGSTFSIGRGLIAILTTARPVSSIPNNHGYAVLILNLARGPASRQPGVATF